MVATQNVQIPSTLRQTPPSIPLRESNAPHNILKLVQKNVREALNPTSFEAYATLRIMQSLHTPENVREELLKKIRFWLAIKHCAVPTYERARKHFWHIWGVMVCLSISNPFHRAKMTQEVCPASWVYSSVPLVGLNPAYDLLIQGRTTTYIYRAGHWMKAPDPNPNAPLNSAEKKLSTHYVLNGINNTKYGVESTFLIVYKGQRCISKRWSKESEVEYVRTRPQLPQRLEFTSQNLFSNEGETQ